MKLTELVARGLYSQTNLNEPFDKLDSNIKDFYSRCARNEIPKLMCGYFKRGGKLDNAIKGAIIDANNSHSFGLTDININSICKRITRQMPEILRQSIRGNN